MGRNRFQESGSFVTKELTSRDKTDKADKTDKTEGVMSTRGEAVVETSHVIDKVV